MAFSGGIPFLIFRSFFITVMTLGMMASLTEFRFGVKKLLKILILYLVWTAAACAVLLRMGGEIGYHGYLHEKAWFPEQDRELVAKSKKIMKDLLGVEPLGYRAPEANLTDETIANVMASGFEYSSNTMDCDWPYFHEGENGQKLIELPFSWLYDDTSHFFFTLQQPERRRICSPQYVRDIWQSEFDGLYEEGGLLNFVLHPQCIGRISRVKMLEDLICYMKTKPGVAIGPALYISRLAREALEQQEK